MIQFDIDLTFMEHIIAQTNQHATIIYTPFRYCDKMLVNSTFKMSFQYVMGLFLEISTMAIWFWCVCVSVESQSVIHGGMW